MIRRYGLSMAIFAPGWTHETLKTDIPDIFFETYCRRDNGFWLNMYPYLYTHPITRPFVTTFYLGADRVRKYILVFALLKFYDSIISSGYVTIDPWSIDPRTLDPSGN